MASPSHRGLAQRLPSELWLDIFSNLRSKDVGRALASCRTFSSLGSDIWRAVCERHWPARCQVVIGGTPLAWKALYDYFEWRDEEQTIVPALSINTKECLVTPKHRTTLNEWLMEVCMEWQLDTSVAFKTVAFVDHCLRLTPNVHPKRLQLLGISCLRVAMMAFQELPTTQRWDADWVQSKLDPALAAFMTGDSYTPEEIEDCTCDIVACVPPELPTAPTVRTYLRYWWFWMTKDGAVPDDALYLYTAAGLFAQLSLLNHQLCATPPSLVAAAALGLSMRAFGLPGWPRLLAGYAAYSREELEAPMAALALLQESAEVSLFRQYYLANAKEYELVPDEVSANHPAGYERALQLISGRCAVLPPAGVEQRGAPPRSCRSPCSHGGGADCMACSASPSPT